MVGVRLALAEYPSWVIGGVMSGYFVGLLAAGFSSHKLIASVGHIRAFATLASVMSAATLAHPLLVDPFFWLFLRFVEGYCLAGLAMCTESWLNDHASNETRGRILSIYQIAVYLSQGLGQFLINLGEPSGFTVFVIASMTLSLALVPIASFRIEAPPLPEPHRFGVRKLYAISPLGVAGTFVAGLVLGAFYSLGPYYATESGFSVAETSQFMGLIIIGGLFLQWPIGRLSDHFDRRLVLIWICIALCLICLAVIVAPISHGALLVLGTVYGGVLFTIYPLSIAHTNDHIEAADMVAASAGMVVAYGIGAIIGPLAASVLMGWQGPNGLFSFTAGVSATTTAFAFWRMTRRAPVPVEEQAPFQAVPRTTVIIGEMDPRAHEDGLPEEERGDG